MSDSSRTQGRLICIGVGLLGLVFVLGILNESYWALAIPVAVGVAFVLGLAFWVGWTIATIQIEPEPEPDEPADDPAESAS